MNAKPAYRASFVLCGVIVAGLVAAGMPFGRRRRLLFAALNRGRFAKTREAP
jgi:hypothetical protein